MTSAVDGLFQQLMQAGEMGASGWSSLDPNLAAMREEDESWRRQRQEQAAVVAEALDNPAGRKFLDWLARRTIYRGPSEDARASSDRYLLDQAERQGARNVVFMILAALAAARGEEGEEANADE